MDLIFKDKSIFFDGHLNLPNGEKVQVFEQKANSELILTKQFIPLWGDLSNIGESTNRGGFITTEFALPPLKRSQLIGESFLSDPNSIVRVVSFRLLNNGGPIINGGFVLNIFNNSLIHEVRWSVCSANQPGPLERRGSVCGAVKKLSNIKGDKVRIGFYTSDDFQFNATNNLFLIAGSKGASLFTASQEDSFEGKFFIQGVSQIYVAVDQEVQVSLTITAFKPKVLSFPEVTPEEPFTGTITIKSKKNKKCSNEFILPTFTLTAGERDILIKRATPLFEQVAALIRSYLDLTSLSILLWRNPETMSNGTQNAVARQIVQQGPPPYEKLKTFFGPTGLLLYAYVSMLSTEFVADRIWAEGQRYLGLRLSPPFGTYPKIDYSITIRNTIPPRTGNIEPFVSCQWTTISRSGFTGFWYEHIKVNPATGREIGKNLQEWPPIPFEQTRTLNTADPTIPNNPGPIYLKQDATGFNLSVYFYNLEERRFREEIFRNTTFNSITVTYVKLPE